MIRPNRKQRRACHATHDSGLSRRQQDIDAAIAYLAKAGRTATGGTLLHPDGSVTHLDAKAVRKMLPAGGPQ